MVYVGLRQWTLHVIETYVRFRTHFECSAGRVYPREKRFLLTDRVRVKCQHDCSVSSGGFEIVKRNCYAVCAFLDVRMCQIIFWITRSDLRRELVCVLFRSHL
jgi:hypothetical protein